MLVDEVAAQLNANGIGRNDRVAIVLPNGPEMAAAFVAVSAVATSAPLNPTFRGNEFDFYLSDLHAKALLVASTTESPAIAMAESRNIPVFRLSSDPQEGAGVFKLNPRTNGRLPDPEYAQPDDVALVLHTSGTTAKPKMVPLSHRNLCASAHNVAAALELTEEDRCLNIMPLFHIHGLVAAVLASLDVGSSVVCAPGFLATHFFEWLDEHRTTWFPAVPTMHQAILARAEANRPIIERCPQRLIRSSSAAMPPQVAAELERVFRAPVIEAYGMTEAAHQMCSNPLPPQERKYGSVGLPAGPDVAIMDDGGDLKPWGQTGEVVIRGANVTVGYANNWQANAQSFTDGWFRTGDQGYIDEDGYLYLTGRLKEIINRGGEKISPREVDEVLLDHPAVSQAVAFAMPDPRLGEEVAAAVVLREKANVSEPDVRAFAAERLADFKVPRRVIIVDEVPKGPTGKLQRIGLAEKLGLVTSDDATDTTAVVAGSERECLAPRTETEARLLKLWSEVLRIEPIGVEDNFFDLGGDSVLAAQVIARARDRMDVELAMLLFFESPTVRSMSAAIEREDMGGSVEAPGADDQELDSSSTQTIRRRSADQPASASFAQQRLWFIDQLELGSFTYNNAHAIRLCGPLDPVVVCRVLNEIVRRHESLRTTFSESSDQLVLAVAPALQLDVPLVDLSGLARSQREEEAAGLIRELTQAPFDLSKGPLLRARLLRLADQEHLLVYVVHHIVFDHWSDSVLLKEFLTLYHAYALGMTSPLEELAVRYSDYAAYQRRRFEGEALERQLAYWNRKLGGSLPSIDLPTDRPRPRTQTHHGAGRSLTLAPSLMEALKRFSRREQVTLFMTLLASFKVLMFRYTGQDDIPVGTPISGRNHAEIEGLIGFFVNTLVLRSDLSGDPSFQELVRRVRGVALDAYAHQDLAFEKLVEQLQPQRDLSRNPLFQVLFNMQNLGDSEVSLPSLIVEPVELPQDPARFDLTVYVVERLDSLSVTFNYNTDLFSAERMQHMLEQYEHLLEQVVESPESSISSYSLVTKRG